MNTWINGRARTTLPSTDRGLQYGDGLFETMRVSGARIRLMELHLERLYGGLKRLNMPAPTPRLLRTELKKIAARESEGVLKLIVTRGSGLKAVRPGYRPSGVERPVRIVTVHALSPAQMRVDPESAVRVRLCRTPLSINPALAGLKTLNRLDSVLARGEWRDARVWEGLMGDADGHWLCGTMSNLFLRRGSLLTTPALDRAGVAGVMRRWVLQQAPGLALRTRETRVSGRDLVNADEVFMTNAVVGIKSVRCIEGGAMPVRFDRFDASRRLRTLLEAL
jgi:4-amino-4-deoxychorismate lyase